MSLTDGKYDPCKMLELCTVNPFSGGYRSSDAKSATIMKILAAVATHHDGDEDKLIKKIGDILEEMSSVSFNSAMDAFVSVTNYKDEEKSWDGLDAICYHTSGRTLDRMTAAIKKVQQRFEKISAEDAEKRRCYIFNYAKSSNPQGFIEWLREKYPLIADRKMLCVFGNEATPEFRAFIATFGVTLADRDDEKTKNNGVTILI